MQDVKLRNEKRLIQIARTYIFNAVQHLAFFVVVWGLFNQRLNDKASHSAIHMYLLMYVL